MKNSMKISTEKEFKTKWYDNPVWVYVLIVLFFPVGLYGLYKNKSITKWVKYPIFSIVIFYIIFCFVALFQGSQTNTTNVQSSPETSPAPISQQLLFAERNDVSYDANGNKATPQVIYWIVEQELDDTPIKSQVVWHVAVEGKYDNALLRDLATHLYKKATELKGFKYYNPATHYQILIYASEDRAKSKSGNWLALVNKIKDKPLDYKENESMILEAQKPATKKFGLSENTRMQIYKEIVIAERRAMSETEKKYDLSTMQGTPVEKMKVFGSHKSKLEEQYKNSLAKKYKINREQLSEIANEGFLKGWAFPASE